MAILQQVGTPYPTRQRVITSTQYQVVRLDLGAYYVSAIILLWFLCLISGSVQGQTGPTYEAARESAFAGRYLKSRELVRQLLATNPDQFEAQILMARTYNWEAKYDSAAQILVPLLEAHPEVSDAKGALLDCRLWAKNYSEALVITTQLLLEQPKNNELKLKKAQSYQGLNQEKQGLALVDSVLAVEPGNAAAKYLRSEFLAVVLKSQVGVNYYLQPNSDNTVWHMAMAEYMYRFKRAPSLVRYSYAVRFGNIGHQVELDCYPLLSAKTYLYVNAGLGNGTGVFPNAKGGIEIYQGLPLGFEVNAGIRYLGFSNQNVYLLTSELGKYLGDWWIGMRGFYSPLTTGDAFAGVGSVRRYIGDANRSISLAVSQGTIPTLVNFFDQRIAKLSNTRVSLDLNWGFGSRFVTKAGLWYEYDQVADDRFISRYTATVGLYRNF